MRTIKTSSSLGAEHRKRVPIFLTVFALLSLGVLVKYAMIMLGPADSKSDGDAKPFVERGPILDRNGRILALQTRLGNITLWCPAVINMDILVQDLAPILEIPAETLREHIESSSSNFVYLKKKGRAIHDPGSPKPPGRRTPAGG
jgi:cell division protein FtsI (penicillin-binding protein 3)